MTILNLLFSVLGGPVQFVVDWESVIANIGEKNTYAIRGVILGVQVWAFANWLSYLYKELK